MFKLTSMVYTSCASILFFSILSTQTMENQVSLEKYDTFFDYFENKLPSEIIVTIQPFFQNNFDFFINLRATCKKLNEVLTFEKIGALCKKYKQRDKDLALKNLINTYRMHNYSFCNRYYNEDYKNKRVSVLGLICAGANQCSGYHLLEKAVINNDTQLAEMIFKYDETLDGKIKISKDGPFKAVPALLNSSIETNNLSSHMDRIPLAFAARSVAMAQVFIKNGADIHKTIYDDTNVLWHILDSHYPCDLMKFYLDNKVDARIVPSYYQEKKLLHRFAQTKYTGKVSNLSNYLEKAKLLLSIKYFRNDFDKYRNTPLDILWKSFEKAKENKAEVEILVCGILIRLFEEYGCHTGQTMMMYT